MMQMDAAATQSFRFGRHILAGAILGLLLVGGVGGWAATATLTGAVVAAGAVNVDQNLKSIQHRDGGIISEITVRKGDRVEKGQVLMRIDDTSTRAELSIVRAQLVTTEARRARLLAERDNLPKIAFPPEIAASLQAGSIVAGETRLFEGNRMQRQSRKHQLQLTIEQTEEEIEGLEAQLRSKRDEIEIVEREHARLQTLTDLGLMEVSRLFGFSRDGARMLGERGEIEAGIARARMRINEINLQIMDIDEIARTEAQRELTDAEGRLAELSDRRVVLEDLLARTEIRAPIAGVINELNVDTLGGVITPAEVLVTLVPHDARLQIEARIAPTMIDQVAPGQPARVRFPAFNQRTTPELHGVVTQVSPATARDTSTGETFYLAVVHLEESELDQLKGRSLLPGMPVEVYITTEERAALSYMVKPVTDQMARVFTER